jgi:hypothetical protein
MAHYHSFGRTKATHPFLTVKVTAGQYAILRRAQYFKESATAGVVERAWVQRYNSGGVTVTSHTVALNTRSAAARSSGGEWGTAPTAVGNPIVMTEVGDKPVHRNSWRPPRPYAGIYLVDADEVGIDATSTTNTSTDYALAWDESDTATYDRKARRRTTRDYWGYQCHYNSINAGDTAKPRSRYRINYAMEAYHAYDRGQIGLQMVPVGGGGLSLLLATVLETDSILGFGRSKAKALPLSSEADSALTMNRLKLGVVGLASEIDTALAFARAKLKAIGIITETDSIIGFGRLKTELLTNSGDVSAAITLNRLKAKAISLASALNSVLGLGRVKSRSVVSAGSAEIALTFSKSKKKPLPLITESDLAVAITRLGAVVVSTIKQAIVTIGRF